MPSNPVSRKDVVSELEVQGKGGVDINSKDMVDRVNNA